MAHWASKYGIYILSIPNYEEGVAYSSVMSDFPATFGPDTFYDTWVGQKYMGRDPVTGYPLLITTADRYIPEVVDNGITATSAGVAPPIDDPIDVCSLDGEVTSAGVMSSIDAHADHVIYGVWNVQPGADPDDLPPVLADYYIDSVMPELRWQEVRTFLIDNGVAQGLVDAWRSKNPDATPRDIKDKFENFVS